MTPLTLRAPHPLHPLTIPPPPLPPPKSSPSSVTGLIIIKLRPKQVFLEHCVLSSPPVTVVWLRLPAALFTELYACNAWGVMVDISCHNLRTPVKELSHFSTRDRCKMRITTLLGFSAVTSDCWNTRERWYIYLRSCHNMLHPPGDRVLSHTSHTKGRDH